MGAIDWRFGWQICGNIRCVRLGLHYWVAHLDRQRLEQWVPCSVYNCMVLSALQNNALKAIYRGSHISIHSFRCLQVLRPEVRMLMLCRQPVEGGLLEHRYKELPLSHIGGGALWLGVPSIMAHKVPMSLFSDFGFIWHCMAILNHSINISQRRSGWCTWEYRHGLYLTTTSKRCAD
jgi:hypothetical protein